MINTKKVRGRRVLAFDSLAEAIVDGEHLAAAERAGTLRATGNWTLGQALGHLAFWAAAPLDGYPPVPRAPWFLRMMAPWIKARFLRKGLMPGLSIPNMPGGTYGVALIPTDQGLAQCRQAFERLTHEAPTVANPFFGPLTHEEWIKLNVRHAELHLSFFHPE
ncbi:MAG: DUF1569 domain-containing protein [Pirellulales bacterium]